MECRRTAGRCREIRGSSSAGRQAVCAERQALHVSAENPEQEEWPSEQNTQTQVEHRQQ